MNYDFSNFPIDLIPVSYTHLCTRVFTSAGYKLLGDLYYCFGEQYFVEKVSALTGISIDYYYFMNVTEAPEIIKRVGEFTVCLLYTSFFITR